MASISSGLNGRRMIQFVGPDRRRKSIRLGKLSLRQAETVRIRVEHLVAASLTRSASDGDTARWVADIDDALHEKLAAAGLVAARHKAEVGAFIEAYIQSRHDTKPRTEVLYRETMGNLVAFFGETKPLRDVTPGDADDFRLFLLGKGLGENTVRRRLGRAKQFFKAAVRRRLIEANPFADQKCAVGSDPTRMRFITRGEAERVLAACPDADWRLIFALARFGGLRTPSETLKLRWADIDWANERMTVTSPKTEHLEGKGSRRVPLFPELRPYLEEVFEQAEPAATFVLDRYQGHTNLGVPFRKIIQRSGIEPWPKLFQNLRATRETELAEEYPMHVVCAWIGNSQPVAAKHYLQVTEHHFRQAAGDVQRAAESAARPLRNPMQHAIVPSRKDRHLKAKTPAGAGVTPLSTESCETARTVPMPPLGLEGGVVSRDWDYHLRNDVYGDAALSDAAADAAYLKARWPDASVEAISRALVELCRS